MKKHIKHILSSVIIVSLILSFSGCSNLNEASENNTLLNTSTENNMNNTIETDTTEKSLLTESDFIVEYENYEIKVGENSKDLFNTIGEGTASEENNWGFIGYDQNNKYKYYSHGYPSAQPKLFIRMRTNISDGNTIISDIDITNIGTNKGITLVSSVEDMIATYGEADKILDFDDNITNYQYSFEDMILNFYVNSTDNKIHQIIISYNDNIIK